jgi:Protein prenyltransferase alpha subunit repeat
MYQTKSERANGERLFRKVDELWRSDALIDEAGILVNPGAPEMMADTSAHKLGVHISVLPALIKYTGYLFKLIQSSNNAKTEIDDRNDENDGNNYGKDDAKLNRLAEQCTRCALLFAASNYTMWNCRKQLTVDKFVNVDDELRLVGAVLRTHTKASDAWAHRRWLISVALGERKDDVGAMEVLLRGEIELCTRVAVVRKRNYYAWTHRGNLVVHMSDAFARRELDANRQWIRCQPADYCGFFYRQKLLGKLRSSVVELGAELALCDELLDSAVDDRAHAESLWQHRRVLVSLLSKSSDDFVDQVVNPPPCYKHSLK